MKRLVALTARYQLRHRTKGLLMLVPCATHDHDACWIFAADLAFTDTPTGPVPLTKTKAKQQIGMLCTVLDYAPRDLVVEPLRETVVA